MATHWHSDQRNIIASHNGARVSVEAPVRGQYTDSRLWLRLFRQSVAEASLRLAEVLTTSDPYNLALRHWWLKSQGGTVKCPYEPGTRQRAVYDNQMRRMEGLAGCTHGK